MKIVVFGLSISSSWGNGHATTFRALCRALNQRGHEIVFFERNVEWYESNRDLPEPGFCDLRLYESWPEIVPRVRNELRGADVAMVGSYFPDGVEALNRVLDSPVPVRTFYDIDTPITIAQLRERGQSEYLRCEQIHGLDIYFSFTGGPILREIESRFGAPQAVPLYCSFDPEQYHSFPPLKRFACDLSYMGTYATDRQPKLEELLCEPARRSRDKKFIVAGPQYPKTLKWPSNVKRITHLNPRWHARFYSSSRLTLNVTRRDMVMAGYSPSVRLFEAAACGAAIVSDTWPGLTEFFSPQAEILLPETSEDVLRYIHDTDDQELRKIGRRAQERVLEEHTSDRRAQQFEQAVNDAKDKSKRHADTPAIAV